jgi:rhodanese-related sulfurtransferase
LIREPLALLRKAPQRFRRFARESGAPDALLAQLSPDTRELCIRSGRRKLRAPQVLDLRVALGGLPRHARFDLADLLAHGIERKRLVTLCRRATPAKKRSHERCYNFRSPCPEEPMGQLAEFAANHPLLALSVLVSLTAVILYELRLRTQGLHQLSASDAVRLINKGATIIDVRKPEAFGAGHIVNARNVPFDTLSADPAGAVEKAKNRPLLTVCDNGTSSAKAAGALRRAGYEIVFSLRGGLASWRSDNLPLVK